MVSKSMKRIIWGMGWYLVWALDNLRIFLKGNSNSEGMIYYEFIMFAIWIIPLFLFKDDKISSHKTRKAK